MKDAFCDPFHLDGATISMCASVGIASSGPGEQVTDQLVSKADVAMFQAKRSGGGVTHHVADLVGARGVRRGQEPPPGDVPA